MPSSSRLHAASRRGRWGSLLLVAAVLPALGPAAAPAFAASCANEQPEALPPSACDDATPPDTSLSPMTPAPNTAGWTRTNDVSFSFAAVNTDPADTDPMELECKLEGPSQAHDWKACGSPTQQQYTDLVDTRDGAAYTFSVRAFDSVDWPWDYDDPTTPLVNEEEVSDEDKTPATVTWKQDTVAPVAFIFEGPYDGEGTGWPIVKKPEVSYLLESSENNAAYRCQLDGSQVACDEGAITLRDLSGGSHTFTLSVTDRAGNTDESAETAQFVVPHNVTNGKNWARKNAQGYFAGDVLQTKRAGARIKFRAQNIREFLVVAPAGPKLGKIRVRTGTGFWKTYDLGKGKATKYRYIQVRDAASPLFSGPILIESLSSGKVVRVDALVFPPS